MKSGRPGPDPLANRYGCFVPDLTGLAMAIVRADLPRGDMIALARTDKGEAHEKARHRSREAGFPRERKL